MFNSNILCEHGDVKIKTDRWRSYERTDSCNI